MKFSRGSVISENATASCVNKAARPKPRHCRVAQSAARVAHNHEVARSSRASATSFSLWAAPAPDSQDPLRRVFFFHHPKTTMPIDAAILVAVFAWAIGRSSMSAQDLATVQAQLDAATAQVNTLKDRLAAVRAEGTAKQAELDAIAAAVPGIQASATALTTAVAEVTAALG